jgi:endonuclease-3
MKYKGMSEAARVPKVIAALRKQHPRPKVELNYSTPLELLVAVILSAQCTDKRVNMVTPHLFKKYKTARDYARANPKVFEQEIRSTGFYRNKARNIIGACRLIDEKFGGHVPKTMDELLALPGVARKTANIVLSAGFGVVEGIPVDTHVLRVSQRLGLADSDNPGKVEQQLMAEVPRREWFDFANLLIFHGRYCCTAKKPDCPGCTVNRLCPSGKKFHPEIYKS